MSYDDLNVPALREQLRNRELPVSGNKPALIARLLEHDAAQEAPEEEGEAASEEQVRFPSFQGARVVRILGSGHTKTHFHCKMDNGTTMHVPINKFE